MLTESFEQALLFASQLHRDQCRKGSQIPYISHLMTVAALVLEHGGNETEAIAALLHDSAEDQGGAATLAKIREEFGEEVARIVEGCSDTLEMPKPAWEERKKAYLEHLRSADASVLLVATADKVHNARSLLADYRAVGERVWDRFNARPHRIVWWHEALVQAFRESNAPTALVDELERIVAELTRLRKKKSIEDLIRERPEAFDYGDSAVLGDPKPGCREY